MDHVDIDINREPVPQEFVGGRSFYFTGLDGYRYRFPKMPDMQLDFAGQLWLNERFLFLPATTREGAPADLLVQLISSETHLIYEGKFRSAFYSEGALFPPWQSFRKQVACSVEGVLSEATGTSLLDQLDNNVYENEVIGPTTTVMASAWDPRIVFPKAGNETDTEYQKRLAAYPDLRAVSANWGPFINDLREKISPETAEVVTRFVELPSLFLFSEFLCQLDEGEQEKLFEKLMEINELWDKTAVVEFINCFALCTYEPNRLKKFGFSLLSYPLPNDVPTSRSRPMGRVERMFTENAGGISETWETWEPGNFPTIVKFAELVVASLMELRQKKPVADAFHLLDFLPKALGRFLWFKDGDFDKYTMLFSKKSLRSMDWPIFGKIIGRGIMKALDEKRDLSREEVQRILWGAAAGASSGEAFFEDFAQLDEFSGGELCTPGGDMHEAATYKDPQIFSVEDCKMLEAQLDEAYGSIDPGWLGYLKRNIAGDLQNPKVRFFLLRRGHGPGKQPYQERELIGLCKIKPLPDGTYYFGTHYVARDFQGMFNLGKILQDKALEHAPPGTPIVATVAVENPAMTRHIENAGAVGIKITTEGDEISSSKNLVEFAWNNPYTYLTKDVGVYTPQVIRSLARESDDDADIKALAVPNANFYVDFSREAQVLFDQGFHLTRIVAGESGSDRVFLFEKPKERVAQIDALEDRFLAQPPQALWEDVIPEVGEEEMVEVEAQEKVPPLIALKTQYEALSAADRTCSKGVLSWEEVVSALPDMDEFLTGVESLSDPEVYWIDEGGQLVVGDGCAEPAKETLNLDYNESRIAAMSVPNRGLITLDEYRRKNKGQFDSANFIWLESGENPQKSRLDCADWLDGGVRLSSASIDCKDPYYGSRRVLRLKLNLGSSVFQT